MDVQCILLVSRGVFFVTFCNVELIPLGGEGGLTDALFEMKSSPSPFWGAWGRKGWGLRLYNLTHTCVHICGVHHTHYLCMGMGVNEYSCQCSFLI